MVDQKRIDALKEARLRRLRSGNVLDVVQQNIDALLEHERRALEQLPISDRIAERVTAIAGSSWFLYANVAWFTIWILMNEGWYGMRKFDPYPFGLLTLALSIEAIVLSIFVLVSQNRMQSESDRRSELDVQINLLTEYEITQVLKLTTAIARKLEVAEASDPDLRALLKEVNPTEVLEQIEERRKGTDQSVEVKADPRTA
jgi:uncharacterized membrane protein